MRSLAEHLHLVVSRVRPLEPLALPLLDANGCVLAVDVTAPVDLPGYHQSAVIGYAARAADIAMASPTSVLSLRELPPGAPLSPGGLVPVGEGAPLPHGADCVVPYEYTDRGVPVVRVGRSVARGGNVIMAGSQVRRGTRLLSLGQVLGAREIALLAAIGVGRVPAYPRPRVAVLTTGSELVDPSRMQPGILGSPSYRPDVNGVSLACAVVQAGALSYRVGPVIDDPVRLRKILDDQLGRADMVVTTGGIGDARDDVLRPVIATMGTVDFARVAMHPGTVHGVGSLGASNVPLVALPGEPMAAFVGFELFVRPVLRRLMGHSEVFGSRRQVVLTGPVEGAGDVATVVPVALSGDSASPVGSGLEAAAHADALVIVPPGPARAGAGQRLTAVILGGT